ncbi:MAG: hypothetical protein ACJA1A_002077 [Saprospiraceae bacterium]|jgi:hypothetical protein|tara:strand:+ start:883 stop:1425 length:543 start_codon:yes stop_codon:yes gene_type:complete
MKPYLSILISVLLLQSCDKEVVPPPLLPCEHDDFHVSFRFNGSCETQVYTDFSKGGGDLYIVSGRTYTEEIAQFLSISLLKESNLNDTLWIEAFDVTKSFTDRVIVTYYYSESSGLSGSFRIPSGQGTKEDYLIIDYYNSDTTILEGRFQCKFKERSVASWVNAPDSLVLTDGSFKVMME